MKPIAWFRDANGCFICTSHSGTYPHVKRNGRQWSIARLILSRKHDMTGLEVRHTCDNKRCVRPDHLLPGTRAENHKDFLERINDMMGSNNPQWIDGRRSDPAFMRAKSKAQRQAYSYDRLAELREYQRNYRRQNADKVREYHREYRKKHSAHLNSLKRASRDRAKVRFVLA